MPAVDFTDELIVERWLAVADAIEAESEHFDLSDFCTVPAKRDEEGYSINPTEPLAPTTCGTTACIAGWANYLAAEHDIDYDAFFDDAAAAKWLGFPRHDRRHNDLFLAHRGSIWHRVANEFGWDTANNSGLDSWKQVTGVQAADVMRRIVAGELEL